MNSSAHELLSKKYATFFTHQGFDCFVGTLDVIFGHESRN